MAGVTITVDVSGLVPWSQYVSQLARKVASMAGRDAIKAMRAEGSRQVRSRKSVKVAAFNKVTGITYPSGKDVLVWTVTAQGVPMPVAAYPHRPTKAGVSVQINRGNRKVIHGAFRATMGSGHVGVFRRDKSQGYHRATRGKYAGKLRQPIREAYSTTVANAFGDAAPAMETRGRTVFKQTFDRVVRAEAAGRKR